MCRASISASRLNAFSITAWTFPGLTGGLTVMSSVTPTTPLTLRTIRSTSCRWYSYSTSPSSDDGFPDLTVGFHLLTPLRIVPADCAARRGATSPVCLPVGLAVDHQRVRVLAVDEPGFGGGHLAVGGQPDGLAVRRPDVDRAGPPGAVDPGAAERAGQHRGDQARPGQHGGLDDADVQASVGQVRTVRGRRPLGHVPAVAGEVEPQPPAPPVQDQLVRPT